MRWVVHLAVISMSWMRKLTLREGEGLGKVYTPSGGTVRT